MSRVGKPMAALDEIARLLRPATGMARVQPGAGPIADDAPDAFAVPDDLPPVYAGAPVAMEDDRLIFDAAPEMTSRMDFRPDQYGYLINGEGLALMGRADDAGGGHAGLRLAPIRLEHNALMPARATSAIRYRANLPREPVTAPSGGGDDQEAAVSALARGALAGGDIRVFDAHGRPLRLRLRWVKRRWAETDGFDGWRLLYRIHTAPLATQASVRGWQAAGDLLRFDARGRLAEPAPITLSPGRGMEPVALDFGRSGLTQFADSTGLVKVLACAQNGWPPARLREVAVRADGRILGAYDNGRVELLGVAAFARSPARRRARRAA